MDSTQINLNLRVEEGRLSGHASDADGGDREFSGWLGMIGAIDALLGEAGRTAPVATATAMGDTDADR